MRKASLPAISFNSHTTCTHPIVNLIDFILLIASKTLKTNSSHTPGKSWVIHYHVFVLLQNLPLTASATDLCSSASSVKWERFKIQNKMFFKYLYFFLLQFNFVSDYRQVLYSSLRNHKSQEFLWTIWVKS
jgi:hypothetical protein